MHQTRLNWYMVLHAHSDETDELNLQDIAKGFCVYLSTKYIRTV